jgi:hypothetical protein
MAHSFNTFLIDPIAQQITEVHFHGDYAQIYKLIDADCYDMARINEEGDGICVDDEGLFKEDQSFFYFDGYPQPLAGKGLVLGCRASDGETVAPHLTLQELRDKVKFVMPARDVSAGSVRKIVWVDVMTGHLVEVEA